MISDEKSDRTQKDVGCVLTKRRTVLKKLYGNKDTKTLQSELRHSDDVESFMEANQSEFDLISMSEEPICTIFLTEQKIPVVTS